MADDDADDLAADIFGVPTYEVPRPPEREFAPWHRPRKQYVRVEQWQAEIEGMLARREAAPDVLKYLGLPGDDLLDIRYLHQTVCQSRGVRLSFLGFNTALGSSNDGQTDANVSIDEVRRLELVDVSSDVLKDDVCLLGDKSSLAYQRAFTAGPFDIVNLDLCDGFGKHQPGTLTPNHYSALASILSIQVYSKTPWLLLLTTRVGKGDIHAEFLQRMNGVYEKNLTEHEIFRNASRKAFNVTSRDEMEQTAATEKGHVDLFLTSLCKWLYSIASSTNPAAIGEVKTILGYKVAAHAACEDLVSVAIEFTPTPSAVSDAAGIIVDQRRGPNEARAAVATIQKVSGRGDVDRILAEEEQLRTLMVEGMADLLVQARYDRQNYLDWLAKN